jgi:hypothetical protein
MGIDRTKILVPLALLTSSAHATDYLTLEEAEKVLFPEATAFEPLPLAPTPEELREIGSHTSGPWSPRPWAAFAARKDKAILGYLVRDAVLGKFQLIDYVVSFRPDGAIGDVEILSYREAYGVEVRTKAWRSQFVAKGSAAPLEVGRDIKNISGATLSCTHLTEGIKRLSTLVARKILPAKAPE